MIHVKNRGQWFSGRSEYGVNRMFVFLVFEYLTYYKDNIILGDMR